MAKINQDSFGFRYLRFIRNLEVPKNLPDDTEILHPHTKKGVLEGMEAFFQLYYNDNNKRVFLVGINPGRFGCGVTGIHFTDPELLRTSCRIKSSLEGKSELSALFIHEMIAYCGGVELFFSRFFLTALSPIGFLWEGKNRNYYDTPNLKKALKPWMVKSFKEQVSVGAEDVGFSLGQGENFKILKTWNEEYHFFKEVRALPHPRWVMQYRRKEKQKHLEEYRQALSPYLFPSQNTGGGQAPSD